MTNPKLAFRVVCLKAGEARGTVVSQHHTLGAAQRAAVRYDRMLRGHAPTALIDYVVTERQEDGQYADVDWKVGE